MNPDQTASYDELSSLHLDCSKYHKILNIRTPDTLISYLYGPGPSCSKHH